MITEVRWTAAGATLQVAETEESFTKALTACFAATRWYLADLIHADRAPPFVSLLDAVLEATLLKVGFADGPTFTVTCKMQVTFPNPTKTKLPHG